MIHLSAVLVIPRANGAPLSPVSARPVRADEDPVRTAVRHYDLQQLSAI
jgi:hypothetical protein